MQVLDRKRVFIFPSRAGFIFMGVIGLVLIGAMNYDNALAYILGFLLVGLMFTTMLHTYRNLVGLGLTSVEVAPVFAGTAARFELVVADAVYRRRYSLALHRQLPRTGGWWRRRQIAGSTECAALNAAQCSILLPVPTSSRGWLALERIEISSCYPLGIFRAWAYLRGEARCLVYPTPRGSLPFTAGQATDGGEHVGAGSGQDDFAGLRNYVPGDSLPTIHWKASARGEHLLVKKLQGSRATLWLRWADTAVLGEVEGRLSQLAQWIVEADRRGLPYGLELPGQQLAPASGPQHRALALRALALWQAA